VTLNIAVLSREAIYLSGDFRLTLSKGGWTDALDTQKLVPVLKFGWCGMIAFNGAAKMWSGRDVGDWIAEQAGAQTFDERLSEVVDRLRGANSWLAEFQQGRRAFSILLAGFEKRRPFLHILSNCRDEHGRALPNELQRLAEYHVRPRTTEVRAFPDRDSISQTEREEILAQVRKDVRIDASAVIADVNARAATRNQSVSAECVVGRVLATTEAEIRPFGFANTPYFPTWVQRQMAANGLLKFQLKRDERGNELKPIWRGATFRSVAIDSRRDNFVASIHAFGNVEQGLFGEIPPNRKVFCKIATGDEGGKKETFTVTRTGPANRRRRGARNPSLRELSRKGRV
jgi:hypothetical protein